MAICNDINTKYFNSDPILETKQSKYNSNKLLGIVCELCNSNISTEIHHKLHQKTSDKNGFIMLDNKIIHKNHKKNLLSVCEECHRKEH